MYSTAGQHDLLCKVNPDNEQDIALLTTGRVQALAGVKDTDTLIPFNTFSAGGR